MGPVGIIKDLFLRPNLKITAQTLRRELFKTDSKQRKTCGFRFKFILKKKKKAHAVCSEPRSLKTLLFTALTLTPFSLCTRRAEGLMLTSLMTNDKKWQLYF